MCHGLNTDTGRWIDDEIRERSSVAALNEVNSRSRRSSANSELLTPRQEKDESSDWLTYAIIVALFVLLGGAGGNHARYIMRRAQQSSDDA